MIQSSRNDKMEYAQERLLEEMCTGEAYAIGRFGTVEEAGEDQRSQSCLLNIKPCWTGPLSSCSTAVPRLLGGWNWPGGRLRWACPAARSVIRWKPDCPAPGAGRGAHVSGAYGSCPGEDGARFSHRLRPWGSRCIRQCRCSTPCTAEPRPPGGFSTSGKKAVPLATDATSTLVSLKGLGLVACGVDPAHFEAAKQEILNQLAELQRGEFTTQEFEAARRSVVNDLRSSLDEQGRMAGYRLMGPARGRRLLIWNSSSPRLRM